MICPPRPCAPTKPTFTAVSEAGQNIRTAMLIGKHGMEALAKKRVAVFGVGGVGGHVCEALARAGLGALDIFDGDTVTESNLNRQIVALHSTLGLLKCEAMAARVADINPACAVRAHGVFYTPQNAGEYPLTPYDFVVDAVDMVTAKLEIIARAKTAGVPVISSMGAAGKLRPEGFRVMDIAKTRGCPLARVMRKELKKRGISNVPVVCSEEETAPPRLVPPQEPGVPRKRSVPGSISFVPAAAGLVLAGEVVRSLLENRKQGGAPALGARPGN